MDAKEETFSGPFLALGCDSLLFSMNETNERRKTFLLFSTTEPLVTRYSLAGWERRLRLSKSAKPQAASLVEYGS
jgi:hypothetical protein